MGASCRRFHTLCPKERPENCTFPPTAVVQPWVRPRVNATHRRARRTLLSFTTCPHLQPHQGLLPNLEQNSLIRSRCSKCPDFYHLTINYPTGHVL